MFHPVKHETIHPPGSTKYLTMKVSIGIFALIVLGDVGYEQYNVARFISHFNGK